MFHKIVVTYPAVRAEPGYRHVEDQLGPFFNCETDIDEPERAMAWCRGRGTWGEGRTLDSARQTNASWCRQRAIACLRCSTTERILALYEAAVVVWTARVYIYLNQLILVSFHSSSKFLRICKVEGYSLPGRRVTAMPSKAISIITEKQPIATLTRNYFNYQGIFAIINPGERGLCPVCIRMW